MLSPYRVLDLTDDRGEIAGMMFADLGADVIRIEPRDGGVARRASPLLEDAPEGDRSLQFYAYNRGKRSIALDLSDAADRATLLELVAGADFVFESGPDGALARAGIDFDALREANPRIVHTQITPFGLEGPYAGYIGSDLVIAALGGPVSLQGESDRPPVRISVPQVWRHTGAESAVAALIAHARMQATGKAQHVDVSAQSAMTWTMLNAMGAHAIQGKDFERGGSDLQLGVVTVRLVYPCKDGHVVMLAVGGMIASQLEFMVDDGLADASWLDEDWATYDGRVLVGGDLKIPHETAIAGLVGYVERHPKAELLERALAAGITIAPVNTVGDLIRFRHLESREYWETAALPDGSTARTPGRFVRPSETPLAPSVTAPRLDEHGAEIRAELADRPRKPSPVTVHERELPLAGLKVADFSWIGVGPISAKYLADHGATVVRVESESRPDNLRGAGPFKDGEPGWNRSQFFGDFNASKLGLALNLKDPAAIEVAKRLVSWADVFIESFTPGAVARMGLGYDAVREFNPDIVMLSTCLMGQSGPAANMAGYGYHAGAVAGFYELTGWPEVAPSGPWMAYTDTIAPRFAATTLLAALDHRRRTGQGQHIDGSQLEMSLHFLAPEILDYQRNGYAATRLGNRSRTAAPQGVYPTAGDDQWCAIAIDDDEQWRALTDALGKPAWAIAPALATAAGRLAAADEIDAALEAWTAPQDGRVLMEKLQAAGVPAGVVQRSSDLLRDPQYAHRGFYREHVHAEMGPVRYAGHQFRIRDYDSGPRSAAPMIGEHSFDVMRDHLGMSDEEIAELLASGAIG